MWLKGRRGLLTACLLIVALNLPGLCHVSSRPLALDPDTPVILDHVREDMSPIGLLRWFSTDWPLGNGFYRPLIALSLAGDTITFGNWAPGYRLANWALAVLTALGLLVWLRELGFEMHIALLPAAIFSLQQSLPQPMVPTIVATLAGALILLMLARARRKRHHGEASAQVGPWSWAMAGAILYVATVHWLSLTTVVDWIAARTALMSTLFVVWAMVPLTRYLRMGGTRWLVAGVLFVALALCCYEQAVMAPFALALVAILSRGEVRRRVLIASLALLLLLPLYQVVRLNAVGGEVSTYTHLARKSGYVGTVREMATCIFPSTLEATSVVGRMEDVYTLVDGPSWHSAIVLALSVVVFWRLFAVAPKAAGVLLGMQAILFAPMAGLHVFGHYFYLPEIAGSVFTAGLLYPPALSALERGIGPQAEDEGEAEAAGEPSR